MPIQTPPDRGERFCVAVNAFCSASQIARKEPNLEFIVITDAITVKEEDVRLPLGRLTLITLDPSQKGKIPVNFDDFFTNFAETDVDYHAMPVAPPVSDDAKGVVKSPPAVVKPQEAGSASPVLTRGSTVRTVWQ